MNTNKEISETKTLTFGLWIFHRFETSENRQHEPLVHEIKTVCLVNPFIGKEDRYTTKIHTTPRKNKPINILEINRRRKGNL